MTVRLFTYEAKTGEVVEHDTPEEAEAARRHPLGDAGCWGVCPGVSVDSSPESLRAGIVQSIDDMKMMDPLASGSVVHVAAYCQHVRYEFARPRGWLDDPVMRSKFREHPTGWLLVAMLPSLRGALR